MDKSRQKDLKDIYEARQKSKSTKEREQFDKLRHRIMRQNDKEIVEAREELIGSMRVGDGKHVKKVTERIREMTYRKGLR